MSDEKVVGLFTAILTALLGLFGRERYISRKQSADALDAIAEVSQAVERVKAKQEVVINRLGALEVGSSTRDARYLGDQALFDQRLQVATDQLKFQSNLLRELEAQAVQVRLALERLSGGGRQ